MMWSVSSTPGNTPAKTVTDELLMTVDRVNRVRLKAFCESALPFRITTNTTVELYCVAQSFNAKQLKSRVLDFIKRRSMGVTLMCTGEQQVLLLSEIF